MSECDEVADTLIDDFRRDHPERPAQFDIVRKWVRSRLPDESFNVIDSVSWSIYDTMRP